MLQYLRIHHFLLGVFVMSLVAFFVSDVTLSVVAVLLFIYFVIVVSLHFRGRKKQKSMLKKRHTKESKAVAKLNTSRAKEAQKKHDFITNQVAYIAEIWQLSQMQERTFAAFIEKKAYSELYTKMTASLLPQLTKMIEECLERDKVGCKRDVSSRLNELVFVMKAEIKRKKKIKKEDFETMRDVYDHLISEVK
jgi:ABC-type multidrug transport system fused ATPase/permease subunit